MVYFRSKSKAAMVFTVYPSVSLPNVSFNSLMSASFRDSFSRSSFILSSDISTSAFEITTAPTLTPATTESAIFFCSGSMAFTSALKASLMLFNISICFFKSAVSSAPTAQSLLFNSMELAD